MDDGPFVVLDVSSDDDRYLDQDDDSVGSVSTEEDSFDVLMRDYEGLASTPPRTRILRRERSSKEGSRHKSRSRSHRHKKISSHEKILNRVISNGKKYFNAHLSYLLNAENENDDGVDSKKRSSKKTMKRLRDSERDVKLEIDVINKPIEAINSLRTMKVESSNRFLSLSCKLVKTAIQWRSSVPEVTRNRSEFHEHFSALIKSGNADKDKVCKRQLSEEESLWQTELKDMIWLELQAWRADRTPTQQDMYLCEARSMIPQLLDDILNYKFVMKTNGESLSQSTQSSDSGILIADCTSCPGCLSFFCPICLENATKALDQVRSLMRRLEAAESLFPSKKAFGNQFFVYKSPEFVGKLNAMVIWYNIMEHLRFKILILGKQMVSFAQERAEKSDCSSGFSSGGSPGESQEWDFANLRKSPSQPLYSLGKFFHHIDCGDTRTYRKYIEDVLKTKGLRKAMYFLETLYLKVLKRGRIALTNPNKEATIQEESLDDDDKELMRFGYWSAEYQSCDLPSFRPPFLFISRIPLDVLHEFLRMRLENRLEKPSPLSIRQLIKELKEAIKLSVINKHRYVHHCEIAMVDDDEEEKKKIYLNYVSSFDDSVYAVLKLYLDYIEQWVTMTEHEKLQKNILEEEWKFVKIHAPHIPEGECLAGRVFCNLAKDMLFNIAECMKENMDLMRGQKDELNLENARGTYRQAFLAQCRSIQTTCGEIRDKVFHVLSLTKTLIKYLESESLLTCDKIKSPLDTLKEGLLEMWEVLKGRVTEVEKSLSPFLREVETSLPVVSLCREVLHKVYKFAFEYVRDIAKLLPDKNMLAREAIHISQQWINFVTNHCERGRGVRPRWANYGIDFLVFVLDPSFTGHLSEKEFELYKKEVESCVSHVMGAPSNNLPHSPSTMFTSMPRSASPSPNISRGSSVSTPDSANNLSFPDFDNEMILATGAGAGTSKVFRIQSAIKRLDNLIENKRKQAELIGTVVVNPENQIERNIKARTVNFLWQRGIKIGHGRFGKVYTAVNTQTGELMAMKEILLQPNDLRAIRKVGLEFKMFEGIQHENLVKYYGAEVHREELLIFMELCTGGTLESVIASTESGLPEGIVRRYTLQLVTAICVLHEHSIVHRDIKPANIFLTDEGNRIKLGDFGCAVKIKANSTAPGELKGFVGTQAYMAPEVFMHSNSYGHGRAADIWSLGCVVIEMASGKRPWSEFDSNYQIMFKVGMGETPTIPETLSEEGQTFVDKCIQYNPKNRPTSVALKHDPFLKVDSDDEHWSLFNMPSTLENYLKLGIKR